MKKISKDELISFEKMIAENFDNGEYPYLVHLSGGNEDRLIEIFENINDGDWIFSTHRSHYHYLLAGGSREKLEKFIFSGKSMFVFDKELNFYSSSILGATPCIAAGVALAIKRKNINKHVWCFIGDGSEDEGHFVEAVRYVDGHKLPCTFIVEDNDRSVNARKNERWGEYAPITGNCIIRYSYDISWPHGGTGSGKWLKFKRDAIIEKQPSKKMLFINDNYKKMKFIDAVKDSMDYLSGVGCVFLGYNVRHSSAYGTLKDVPIENRIETPVAENLMAGLSLGLSLEGIRPVLFFERHDFIYNALDALVNQADKVATVSSGQFAFPVIIRAVAGGTKPFYAGLTHTCDLTSLFEKLFSFPVCAPKTSGELLSAYKMAYKQKGPVLISENKEMYDKIL